MKRFLLALTALALMTLCFAGTAAVPGDCNAIDLDKHLKAFRSENQVALDKLEQDLSQYRENIFKAVKDIELLRAEMEELLKSPELNGETMEPIKTAVQTNPQGIAPAMNTIAYKQKLDEIKTKIANIEKFMRENCYGFPKQ